MRTLENNRMPLNRSAKSRCRLAGWLALSTALLTALLFAASPGIASASPLAITKTATEVEAESAVLNGTVNPKSFWPATYWFEYGTTTEYGSKTTEKTAGSGFSNIGVNAMIKGLTPGVIYHFRLVAKSFFGEIGYGEDFTTLYPTVPATDVYAKEATLHGAVALESEMEEVTYWFEYGITKEYGSKTAEESVGSGNELVKVSTVVKGLTPNTTYHFRAVVSDGEETIEGGDSTFTTLKHAWSLQEMPYLGLYGGVLESVSCLSGTECAAVGDDSLAESWDGTEWSLMTMQEPEGEGVISELDSVSCTSSTACTAVGHIQPKASISNTLVERWNGTEWEIQESPNQEGAKETILHGVDCTSSTFCIAVGNYLVKKDEWLAVSEIWNGTEWKIQEMPSPVKNINYVYDISCTSSSACTAVGYALGKNLAERWNGSEWTVQTAAAGFGWLESVSCASATSCIATGVTDLTESKYQPRVASWNGSEWETLTIPNPGGAVSAGLTGVSCASSSACSAVGWYEVIEGGKGWWHPLVEAWNGLKWEILPIPEPSSLTDVSCVSSTLCEAVGIYYGARYE